MSFRSICIRHFPVLGIFFRGSLILAALIGVNGCGWLVKPPSDDVHARATLQRVMQHNSQLQQFKGVSQARVNTGEHSLSGRVAWAAAVPNRLRMEWLSPTGKPLTSLAGNGRVLAILSHSDQRHYLLRQTPTVLEKFIHVPISIEEFLNLLVGRPVVPDFHAVQESQESQESDNAAFYGIQLKNRWRLTLAELRIDPDGHLSEERVYNSGGDLLYQIHWQDWLTIGHYSVPGQLSIVSTQGRSVVLKVDRLIPDQELAPSLFELIPPKTYR